MEEMRRIAFEIVQRACLFGSLTIFCVMVGMSFEPRLAFQAGGTLTTLMALILVYKAREALTKNYRRTEMWLYLPKDHPPAGRACTMGERHGYARYLSYLRAVDCGDRDRDVGSRRCCSLAVFDVAAFRPHRRLPMNWKITSRLCGLRRCSTR